MKKISMLVLTVALLGWGVCASAQKKKAKPAAKTTAAAKAKPAGTKFTVKNVSFTMIPVEGGTFKMGATPDQGEDVSMFESPVRNVTLSSYLIAETEVTQALWEAVMGENPCMQEGATLPVYGVSYETCMEFIGKLNELTGKAFRLPTEAEWEYAARGGKKSKGFMFSGSNNYAEVAWSQENSNGEPHPVKAKKANELGLYDMSGNAKEWVSDYHDYYPEQDETDPTGPAEELPNKVLRGGGYSNSFDCQRVAHRFANSPDSSWGEFGLRLALTTAE